MGENIKLKDLYNEEQSFTDIGTIAVPKADGSGDAYYVQRPIINYTLQDPPTRELTDADEGAFAWNAGDGTVFEGDLGNFIGSVEASVAGKTTRPIVRIGVNKHLSGVTVNANCAAILIYLYEELSGSVLLDVLGETGNTDFTAQVGWGQLLLADTSPLEVIGYAKINDPGAVTIGIEQPVGYQKADIFYSLLSEVTQEEQTVSVTENGAQTIVPAAGKSGIRKVALNVNVPSGGGNLQEKSVFITSNGTTEVTPDAGHDGMSKVKAVINVAGGGGNDYYLLKNPLGEMPTYEGGVFQANGKPPETFKPHVTVIGGLNANSALGYKNTEVFSYKKENRVGVTSLIFFWYAEDAETLPAALMRQFTGAWPYGDVTLAKGWNITTFSVNGEETTASTTAATLDAVNMELAAYGGIPKDNFDWAEMDAYTLSFFKDAASKEQSNWNQNDSTEADYIRNRPGAYVQTIAGHTLTFDGDTAGKYVATGWGMVKVSDEIIPKATLQSGAFTVTIHSESGDETGTVNGSDLVEETGIYGFASTIAIMLVVPAAAATAAGIEPGTYLGCDTENTPPQTYVSQFVLPSYSTVVELPETYTQVKQADWSTYENQAFGNTKGCIKNRIGGFIGYSIEEMMGMSISFDGNYENKEHYTLIHHGNGNQYVLVRALDSPLTKTQLLTRKNVNGIKLTYNGVDYTGVRGEVVADFDIGAYVLQAKFTVGDAAQTLAGLISIPFPTMFNNIIGETSEPVFIPVGTYWHMKVPSGEDNANYFTEVNFEFAPIKYMPSEFLETDFSGRDVSAKSVILESSIVNSTKKFKITVDDTGTLKATEVTN